MPPRAELGSIEASDNEWYTLDVKYAQIVEEVPNDPECRFHHRVLLCRVGGAQWIAATPDHDLVSIDLSSVIHHVLPRGQRFPSRFLDDQYGCCAFDPISAPLSILRTVRAC